MKRLLALLFIPLITLAGDGKGGEGSGSHGGQTLPKNGEEYLRDLHDRTSCLWKSGKEFGASIPGFTVMMDKIDKAYPAFKAAVDARSPEIRVCLMEQDLMPIPEDVSNVFVPYVQTGHQAAVRVTFEDGSEDTVYINQTIYNKIPAEERPYLWLHEVTHEFLDFDIPQRALNMRSFIKSIHHYIANNDLTPERFEFIANASKLNLAYINSFLNINQSVEDLVESGTLEDIKGATAKQKSFWKQDLSFLYLKLEQRRCHEVSGSMTDQLRINKLSVSAQLFLMSYCNTTNARQDVINWLLANDNFLSHQRISYYEEAAWKGDYLSSFFIYIGNLELAKSLILKDRENIPRDELFEAWNRALPYTDPKVNSQALRLDPLTRKKYIDFCNWLNTEFSLGEPVLGKQ